jgi:hypothetical protein
MMTVMDLITEFSYGQRLGHVTVCYFHLCFAQSISPLLASPCMELPATPSSHQFGTRKPGEPGLAEWAQKIRALQRQVDQDEEEEHRKLEQEIAASRLARVRRSAGPGRASLGPPPGMLFSFVRLGPTSALTWTMCVHNTLRHPSNRVTSH